MLCKVLTLLSLNTNASLGVNLYQWKALYFSNRTHFRHGLCVRVNNSIFHQLNFWRLWGKWSQRAVSGVRESICCAARKLADASFMISLKSPASLSAGTFPFLTSRNIISLATGVAFRTGAGFFVLSEWVWWGSTHCNDFHVFVLHISFVLNFRAFWEWTELHIYLTVMCPK